MNGKKNKQRPVTQSSQPAQSVQRAKSESPEKTVSSFSGAKKQTLVTLLVMLAIAVVVFLVLRPCLDNQFTNWDDPGYVRDNALIKDISAQGLKQTFSTAIMGNYHPLTILSYGIEYSFVRLDPYMYHRDSLLLHILTCLALFWLVYKLSGNLVAPTVAALLFGLHPMHIESVAWVAARKDVLFGLFYFLSCIAYVVFLRTTTRTNYVAYAAAILFFVGSLLSKPVAVSLPLALLLIDYLDGKYLMLTDTDGTGRKINIPLLLNKLPFFLLSVLAGIKSVSDQRDFKALNTLDVHFNLLERISLGAYALVTYLWKALVPIGMSNFYPYPEKVHDSLPMVYYCYPLVLLVMAVLVWYFLRTKRVVIFGLLFFLANIALLLQFVPVGGAILADRYTYIPYAGLFITAGFYANDVWLNHKKWSILAASVLLGFLGFISALSNKRCADWYDTVSLWRDEVVKHPDVPSAFNNLGFEYFNRGNESPDPKAKNAYFDSSVFFLKEAVRLQPNFVNPQISLGEVARSRGNFPEAKYYYYKALSLSKSDETHNAYLGLAIIYCITGQQASAAGISPQAFFDSAQYCFQTAVRLKPFFPEAHSNYGNFFDMMHNYDSSYRQYSISIEQNPDMYASYLNRARLLQRNDKCDEAMKDFARALEVAPDNGEIYYYRSICISKKGNKKAALADAEKARALGYRGIDPTYLNSLKN